jgi:uncharacterized membrane protein required for colicin V production
MSINILLIAAAILLIYNVADGYKKGMVRQFISLVSLIVLCMVLALAVNGMKSYLSGKIVNVVIVAVLLCLLGMARHILGLIFFSAKVISKLPIIHGVDKILGIAFGAMETVLILWTLYTFVMMLDMGVVGSMIKDMSAQNKILEWCYRNNYLAFWIEKLTETTFVIS